MLRFLLFLLAFILANGCQRDKNDDDPMPETITYLALGDSYTKGESVPTAQNFPHQLADSLRTKGYTVAEPHTIAQTGWRTDDLQAAIAADHFAIHNTFHFVTLCIGVNNQYQHADFNTYIIEFEALLQRAIAFAKNEPTHVIVLSIPDWAYTPYGQNFPNSASISTEIDQYNAANRALSEQYGVQYVDVTATSRLGLAQPNLVATDGLHPSAAQYTAWVESLLPVVEAIVEQ